MYWFPGLGLWGLSVVGVQVICVNMQNHNVIIYTVPACPYCARVFSYMRERGIAYKEIDVIADNKHYAKEMIVKSGQKSVPVTEIDGTIVVGYKPEEFAKLLV